MTLKTKKPAPPCQAATGLEFVKATPLDRFEYTAPLPTFQADFIAARYGIDATRARVVAELAWGR